MKTNKFKVGDKVRVLPNKAMSAEWKDFDGVVGDVLTITGVETCSGNYHPDHNRHSINFHKDCLERVEVIKMNKLIIDDVEINLSDETVAELKDKLGVKKVKVEEREVVYVNLDCVLSPSGTAYKEVISNEQYTHVGTCDEGEVYIYKSDYEKTLYILKSEE